VTDLVNHQAQLVPAPPGTAQGTAPPGTALLTDRYELTMVQASLRSGAANRRAIFEVFARHLPHGRRYGVVAGTGRLLDAIERFRFSPADLKFLDGAGIVDSPTLAFLESYRFSGNIWGYSEGDCYFPGSPILVVEGTFAEAVLLETVTLSILNHDCAIASAASRMVTAAGGRPLIEMGSRRTHERAAVASARAAYLAGFASTSNLQAAYHHGIPSAGTSAHAFTLVHDSERDAFETQLEALGAVPVDGYGVGTSLVTGSGAPTAALVYKLVARASSSGSAGDSAELVPVAKRSVGKPGRGGRKWAVRHRDEHGTALAERIYLSPPEPGPLDRELLRPLVTAGEIVGREGVEDARARHRQVLTELPPYALQLSRGYPAIPTVFEPNGDES
jgi:nicotinate phosphoribosyltransferase